MTDAADGMERESGMVEQSYNNAAEYWSVVLKALQRLHHEMEQGRPAMEAMLRKAYTYTGHDMRLQGRAARALGRREVAQHIKLRADEWRAGASSVKGHHLPLKHVYRWLAELEDGPMRDRDLPQLPEVTPSDHRRRVEGA